MESCISNKKNPVALAKNSSGGVGPLALLWCQGSLGVCSFDRCPGSSLCVVHSCYTVPLWPFPLLIGGSLLGSPHSTVSTPKYLWIHRYLRTHKFLTHGSESPSGCNLHRSWYGILNLKYPWVQIQVTCQCTCALSYLH